MKAETAPVASPSLPEPFYVDESVTLYHGDCLSVLRTLPDESVASCVTSPPYFNLRDYKVDGQIGMEPTPAEYINSLVSVFREVRRVMKDDGTLWVNVGDSYNAYNGNRGPAAGLNKNYHDELPSLPSGFGLTDKSLKPKDLIGIPWMLAFALRADGWYLRGDHVWGKPNGMPESVEDRPTRAHEYVFLLSKSQHYFYDSKAVRTAPKASTITRLQQDIDSQAESIRANGGSKSNGAMKAVGTPRRDGDRWNTNSGRGFPPNQNGEIDYGANLRSVWWIPPAQFKGAHFAVMPELVAEICIRAGSKPGDTIIDPFGGSGTTGAVAREWGRKYIGIDLSADYLELSKQRFGQRQLFPATSPTEAR